MLIHSHQCTREAHSPNPNYSNKAPLALRANNMEPTCLCNHIFTIPLISLVNSVPIACERFHKCSLWALPNPQAARFSSRTAMRNSSQLRWRARDLGASLHALPPSSAPRARALAFRAASSSSQWRGRRTMAQHTSERAAPSQPGLDGDDNLVIGSVQKDRHHELDAGSDDGRSIDLPSMPPSSPHCVAKSSLSCRSEQVERAQRVERAARLAAACSTCSAYASAAGTMAAAAAAFAAEVSGSAHDQARTVQVWPTSASRVLRLAASRSAGSAGAADGAHADATR